MCFPQGAGAGLKEFFKREADNCPERKLGIDGRSVLIWRWKSNIRRSSGGSIMMPGTGLAQEKRSAIRNSPMKCRLPLAVWRPAVPHRGVNAPAANNGHQ